MILDYEQFLSSKGRTMRPFGVDMPLRDISTDLFPFQRQIVRWALRKGKAAVFADTGLGKTRMQIEWARLTGQRVLILAPLAVGRQTVAEAARIGVEMKPARRQDDADPFGITITNYEMLNHFDLSQFGGVVLDESSILKSIDSKTRARLIEACADVPYRLCCTATPAPNDIAEIANHAEFLGVMKRTEMLASFFVHDDEGWRLKGHANAGPFWRWLASWSISVRRPSDLGFSDEGYNLPPLSISPVVVESEFVPFGQLFYDHLKGITERSQVRKQTADQRCAAAAALVAQKPGEQWLVWCGLNSESQMLARAIPGAVEITGSDSPDRKGDFLQGFADGAIRILVTKPKIAGFGMNFQRCARMVFCGLGDSYETYYQAIRRCYRFGQQRPVKVFIVLSEPERVIYDNVLRKEQEAQAMSANLLAHVADYEREELEDRSAHVNYDPAVEAAIPSWLKGRAA